MTINYNQVKSGISYKQHAHLTLNIVECWSTCFKRYLQFCWIPTELCLSKIHPEKTPRQRSREQNQRLVVQPHPANETPMARPQNARPMRHGIWERDVWKRKKMLEKIHSRWIPAVTFLRCTHTSKMQLEEIHPFCPWSGCSTCNSIRKSEAKAACMKNWSCISAWIAKICMDFSSFSATLERVLDRIDSYSPYSSWTFAVNSTNACDFWIFQRQNPFNKHHPRCGSTLS